MALLDAGVNVMESDDVQWRVLTRPADPSQGSSRRCHLAHRGDCPLLTLACITLATAYSIQVYLDHRPTILYCIAFTSYTDTYKPQQAILSR